MSLRSPVTHAELQLYTRAGTQVRQETVNFDDPGAYHFITATRSAANLTFFPWENSTRPWRRRQTQQTAFASRAIVGLLDSPLIESIAHEAPKALRRSVPFTDPDGMSLALVGVRSETIPAGAMATFCKHAIRGFGVTLLLHNADRDRRNSRMCRFGGRARRIVIRFRCGLTIGGVVDIYEAKGFARTAGAG